MPWWRTCFRSGCRDQSVELPPPREVKAAPDLLVTQLYDIPRKIPPMAGRHAEACSLRNDVVAAEKGALEFMLEHRLFKSDKTGKIINYNFTLLSYPHRWHYDVLRGLAYFAHINAPHDAQYKNAMDLLNSHCRASPPSRPCSTNIIAKVFFEMEKIWRSEPVEYPASAAGIAVVDIVIRLAVFLCAMKTPPYRWI